MNLIIKIIKAFFFLKEFVTMSIQLLSSFPVTFQRGIWLFFFPLSGKHLASHGMQIITGLLITNAALQLHIIFKHLTYCMSFSQLAKPKLRNRNIVVLETKIYIHNHFFINNCIRDKSFCQHLFEGQVGHIKNVCHSIGL